MALYEYGCPDCGRLLEARRPTFCKGADDTPERCPCGGEAPRAFNPRSTTLIVPMSFQTSRGDVLDYTDAEMAHNTEMDHYDGWNSLSPDEKLPDGERSVDEQRQDYDDRRELWQELEAIGIED